MHKRRRRVWPAAAVVLWACGIVGGDADGGDRDDGTATEDPSVQTSVPAPPVADTVQPVEDTGQIAAAQDTTGAPADFLAPADSLPPADSLSPADSANAQALLPSQVAREMTVDERLALLLANQEATMRRLDSLSRAIAPMADTVRGLADSGEVLGEAGQRVRNFGVGVIWSAFVVVFFNLVIRSLVWMLDTLAERNASRRLFYKRLVPIVRIVLWVFAAYLIVSVIFRVDAQGLLAAAAAVGVAVGFAAQDLLKNLFGGLILVFDQPFQAGDKISVGGTYGEVVSIGLRSTRIVTADDNLVSVPNAQVVDQQVANANAGQLHCQVVTDLYLPGWADEVVAKRIAFEAASSSKYVYLNKPIVVLVSDVFKETFLTRVRVKAYVLDPRLEIMFQSDVTERARAGFRESGLLRAEHMRSDLVAGSAIGVPASARVEGDADG
jgi:small-conductance mechanosensitive channel